MAPIMSVTLFFRDGRIAEFPSATTAEKRAELIYLLHVGPETLTLESVQAFNALEVALAHVYEHGTLTKVIIPSNAD